MRYILPLFAFALFINAAQGQTIKRKVTRCFTVQQIKIIRANNPNIETDAQFEAWLSPLVNKRKQNRLPVQNYTL
ncbi:MAG: hypothetical protein H7101_11490, partial [Deinococcales bacterium]|nr:hypothetical protein [Chitinophagaceae bacterium]